MLDALAASGSVLAIAALAFVLSAAFGRVVARLGVADPERIGHDPAVVGEPSDDRLALLAAPGDEIV